MKYTTKPIFAGGHPFSGLGQILSNFGGVNRNGGRPMTPIQIATNPSLGAMAQSLIPNRMTAGAEQGAQGYSNLINQAVSGGNGYRDLISLAESGARDVPQATTKPMSLGSKNKAIPNVKPVRGSASPGRRSSTFGLSTFSGKPLADKPMPGPKRGK